MTIGIYSIDSWLRDNADTLADAMIPSARLDAELILAHTLRRDRTWLHAHGEDEIDERELDLLDARIAQRLERMPIAYITGSREFYGREFAVNSTVLIPRPESEDAVTVTLQWLHDHKNAAQLVDVGSGSGCLGITMKLEAPTLVVTLCDVDEHTLRIAGQNALKLNADVKLLKSDLLSNYPLRADIIVANLPYVDRSWEVSPETAHEPDIALFANDSGLQLIYRLIDQAQEKLIPGGALVLESDPRQHDMIKRYGEAHTLTLKKTAGFIQLFEKFLEPN